MTELNAMDQVWCFGAFRLSARRRALTNGSMPVRLGGRAIEILLALVERAGETVSKDELIARAWPNIFVDEANLRVHLCALKKVLGEGPGTARQIVNDPGRGYRFVAPITVLEQIPAARPMHSADLPVRLTRLVGREDVMEALWSLVSRRRLLTLVGMGGVGKTTVALALAERIRTRFADGVHFIDLSSLREPRFVTNALAQAFDFTLPDADQVGALANFVASKHLLIVLDTCEHLVDAVAELAQALHARGAGVHLICTSREPLRVDGEWIYRLGGLSLPTTNDVVADEALGSGAVQLFVERAMACQDAFSLSDANTPLVAEICRRLDGVPLAVELAAARMGVFSLSAIAEGLDDRFSLLSRGLRTAAPRQQTLRATLDWSYALLTDEERTVFNRLSVFRSAFDLRSATACASCEGLPSSTVAETVISLAAKSLLSADVSGESTLFRLLDSARDYAQEQLERAGEAERLSRRHAELVLTFLNAAAVDWQAMNSGKWRTRCGRLINDVRVAIDWATSPAGDKRLAVDLIRTAGRLGCLGGAGVGIAGRKGHVRHAAVLSGLADQPMEQRSSVRTPGRMPQRVRFA